MRAPRRDIQSSCATAVDAITIVNIEMRMALIGLPDAPSIKCCRDLCWEESGRGLKRREYKVICFELALERTGLPKVKCKML